MAVAIGGKVRQRIVTIESDVRCMHAIAHRQRAGRVIARIGNRQVRTGSDVRQVDNVADPQLPGNRTGETGRMIDEQSAGGPSEGYGPRIRIREFLGGAGAYDHRRGGCRLRNGFTDRRVRREPETIVGDRYGRRTAECESSPYH